MHTLASKAPAGVFQTCTCMCMCMHMERHKFVRPSRATRRLASPSQNAVSYIRAARIESEREIFENQQEITTLTVIWARQLVSPQPKLGPVPERRVGRHARPTCVWSSPAARVPERSWPVHCARARTGHPPPVLAHRHAPTIIGGVQATARGGIQEECRPNSSSSGISRRAVGRSRGSITSRRPRH